MRDYTHLGRLRIVSRDDGFARVGGAQREEAVLPMRCSTEERSVAFVGRNAVTVVRPKGAAPVDTLSKKIID